MATVPTPYDPAVGSKLTAPAFQAGVRDPIQFILAGAPIAHVVQTVAQSVANQTWSDITFTTEVVDLDGQHSTTTNTTQVNIGKTLGWYLVSGIVSWATSSAGTYRRARLTKNGTYVDGSFSTADVNNGITPTCVTPTMIVQSTLSTDYVTLQGMHNTGGNLSTVINTDTSSSLTVVYLRANI